MCVLLALWEDIFNIQFQNPALSKGSAVQLMLGLRLIWWVHEKSSRKCWKSIGKDCWHGDGKEERGLTPVAQNLPNLTYGACFYPHEYPHMRERKPIRFTPNTSSVEYPLCSCEDFSLEWQREGGALTSGDGDAGGDADAAVNDSEHIDVVFHACLQAWDGAGGGIAWNPDL